MTDEVKLLPSGCSVPGCPATGDGKPYAGVPTCMRGYAGDPAAYENYIRGCILRANTRVPAPAEADGWRPIESAPKDGTLILACGFGPKGYFVADVKYKDEQWMIFHPEEDDWTVASHRVTHWRPLPSPPSATELQPTKPGEKR